MNESHGAGKRPGRLRAGILSTVLALGSASQCQAFNLAPLPADAAYESAAARAFRRFSLAGGALASLYIKKFRNPVHERITHLAYGCEQEPAACTREAARGNAGAPAYVIDGVQWNDNPPFKLTREQGRIAPGCLLRGFIQLPNLAPDCWGWVFSTAAQEARPPDDHAMFGPEAPILQRTHFGDMQFLHAMAPDGEPAVLTYRKIVSWARFVFGIVNGDIGPSVVVSSPQAREGAQFFPASSAPYGTLTVRQLFTQGSSDTSDERVRSMALGSLLHIIEDSFSKAHVARQAGTATAADWPPPQVAQYLAYAQQDHARHSAADDLEGFRSSDLKGVAIEAVRRVVALKGQDWRWDKLAPILDDVFEPLHDGVLAGPGDFGFNGTSTATKRAP